MAETLTPKVLITAAVALTAAMSATPSAACEWTEFTKAERASAYRIVEGRVSRVRIAHVWIADWRVHVSRAATIETVRTLQGPRLAASFEYRWTTPGAPDGRCARPLHRPARGETAIFVWPDRDIVPGHSRPAYVLTPREYRDADLQA